MNGGRAAQALPYHSLGTNGSRLADRIPGGDVIKFALYSLVVPRAVAMHRRRHAIYHKML
jgi:hypothetical protein